MNEGVRGKTSSAPEASRAGVALWLLNDHAVYAARATSPHIIPPRDNSDVLPRGIAPHLGLNVADLE